MIRPQHLEIQGGTVQSLSQKAGTATLAESVKTNSLTVNGGKLYVYANTGKPETTLGLITVDGELYFGSANTSDTLITTPTVSSTWPMAR